MAAKVYWTRQSREDLRGIRAFIARDAPATASAFVRRLLESVNRLRTFPESGQVVSELGNLDVRILVKYCEAIIESSIGSMRAA